MALNSSFQSFWGCLAQRELFPHLLCETGTSATSGELFLGKDPQDQLIWVSQGEFSTSQRETPLFSWGWPAPWLQTHFTELTTEFARLKRPLRSSGSNLYFFPLLSSN